MHQLCAEAAMAPVREAMQVWGTVVGAQEMFCSCSRALKFEVVVVI